MSMFDRKLAAWLSRPWYDAFVRPAEREQWRAKWRIEVLLIFNLDLPDPALDHQVDQDEGFPDLKGRTADFWKHPLFRHPFSGAIKEPQSWNAATAKLEDLHETCIAALKEVAGKLTSAKEAFLTLWREAPDLARRHESGRVTQLGAFWDLVPAYPEMPFSTIWQRQAAASALASAGSCPALLSFRLGGVQEFIGKSRTTEDYWSGSYLMSFLTWQAAKAVAEELGPDAVIFPSLREQPLVDKWLGRTTENIEIGNFPNGLLAIVPCDDEDSSRRFAARITEEFQWAWDRICRDVKGALEAQLDAKWKTTEWDAIWSRQTRADRVFEIFWTITPRSEGESYGDWYRRTSRQIESRKTLRDFRSTEEHGIKCHQTGAGEAIRFIDNRGREHEVLAGLGYPLQFRFREGERLSAVSIVRRLAARCSSDLKPLLGNTSFPSTASIAATPLIDMLTSTANPEKLKDFSEALKKLLDSLGRGQMEQSPFPIDPWPDGWDYLSKVDGSWWFDESYEKKALEKEYSASRVRDAEAQIKAARAALSALLASAKSKPAKYYAVLAADGDETGKWINGKFGLWTAYAHPDVEDILCGNRPTSPLTHRAIMECLANLPIHVARSQIKDKFRGHLVYAGGDDLLAFVPAGNLTGGMDAYAKAFSQDFIDAGGGWRLLPGEKFTCSIAAMLVHYRTPMSGVVQEALELCEEKAKEDYGRNCGVITTRRQSGQETIAHAKWGKTPFEIAQELVEKLASKKLSPRFIAHLAELASGVENLPRQDAQAKLLRYIFGHTEGDSQAKEWLMERAEPLLENWAGEIDVKTKLPAWRELESFLLTMRFLARMRTA